MHYVRLLYDRNLRDTTTTNSTNGVKFKNATHYSSGQICRVKRDEMRYPTVSGCFAIYPG